MDRTKSTLCRSAALQSLSKTRRRLYDRICRAAVVVAVFTTAAALPGQTRTTTVTPPLQVQAETKPSPNAPASPDSARSTTASAHLTPPFIWGAENEYHMQVGGEVRARLESHRNYDLDRSKSRHGDNDTVGFLRTKLNFDLTYRSVVRAFVEVLDARELGAAIEYGQESFADLQQAFLDVPLGAGANLRNTRWTARIGRQEMNLGRDKRLVEASGWNNLRRRYDGVDLLYRTPRLDLDLFFVQPEYYERRRGDDTITRNGRRRSDEYFYGAYAVTRDFAPYTVEAYFLGLSDRDDHRTFAPRRTSEDGTFGTSDRYTVGSAVYGPIYESLRGRLDYTLEGAYQFGHNSKDPISAWFLRGDTTYTWKTPWTPKLGLVGTLASGDRDPGDGRAGQFSNLFGSNHSPYGIMDVVRPRNLREVALVGSLQPTKKITLEAQAHAYWMDSKTDTGLQVPGQPALRDKNGQSGRGLGQELSLTAEYKHSETLSFEAGAAHLFPGDQPRSLGRDSGASFFYLQTKWSF